MFRATTSYLFPVTALNAYGLRAKVLGATLLVGVGWAANSQAAQANGGNSLPAAFTSQIGTTPIVTHATLHSNALVQTNALSTSHTAAHSALASSNFSVSNVLHAAPQTTTITSTTPAAHSVNWTAASVASQTTAAASQAAQALNLNSVTASFSAGSLAGFHTLTIDVGGKQEQVSVSTRLTAAELVAAQQVLSTGKQDLVLKINGAANGGTFDINSASMKALDAALGGAISSLSIGKGVEAIDSVAKLNLTGTLTNQGTILVGATPDAKTQTTDVISATNIVNGFGGTIASGSISGSLAPTDITLDATSSLVNSGAIHAIGNLNITAGSISSVGANAGVAAPQITAARNVVLDSAQITNGGIVSSAGGNVTLGGSNITNLYVANNAGTISAKLGTIDSVVTGTSGTATLTVNGGNLFSSVANFDAGKGNVGVNVGQLTGLVTGDAGTAHVTAATANLNLGNLDVTGDPTYYNAGGNIVIDSTFASTGGNDLALVASGNIIGNGGMLNTQSASGNGGNLTLIAGAKFTVAPTTMTGQVGPDTSSTLTVTNSTLATKGSATGGYIDLSGITYTGVKTNVGVTSIDTSGTGNGGNGGNVLMVAYKGSGANSGSIADTATAFQTLTGGADTVNASGVGSGIAGNVTIIAPGAITGQEIAANNISLNNVTPVLAGGSIPGQMTISNGTIQGSSASYMTGGGTVALAGSINQALISGLNSVSVYTGGAVNGQIQSNGSVAINAATAGSVGSPLLVNGSPSLSLSATSSAANFNISSSATILSLSSAALPGASTLNVTSVGDILLNGPVNAGTITISLPNATGLDTFIGGLLTATTVNFKGQGGSTFTSELSATNFSINGGISTASLVFDANAAKTTNLLASSITNGNSIDMTFDQAVKVTGAFTNTGSESSISYAGNPTVTTPGVTIAAAINNGTGTFNVNDSNAFATLTETSGAVISAGGVTATWQGAIGTAATPFVTNTTSSFTASNSAPVFWKETGSGVGTIASTSTVNIAGTGAVLNISNVTGTSVTISNTNAAGIVALSGANQATTGALAITAGGSISQAAGTTLDAATVSLTSTTGDIGAAGTAIGLINSGGLSNTANLSAVKGSVYVSDTASAIIAKGASLNNFQFAGTSDLQTTGAITGSAINLSTNSGNDITLGASVGSATTQTVTINSGGNIVESAKAVVVTATTGINLISSNSIGFGGLFQTLQTNAPAVNVTAGTNGETLINNAGNVLYTVLGGTNVQLSSAGAITMASGTANLTSTDLALTSAKSVEFVNGPLSLDGLSVTAPSVLGDNNVVISANSTGFSSTGALSITGGGTINGGALITLGGPKTTSIILGKTDGTSNPLSLHNANTQEIEVTTTGNFTLSFADSISVTGVNSTGPSIAIAAANIVNSTPTVGPLLISSANSIANAATNQIFVTLTGVNPVTLGNAVGQINLQSTANGAATNDGTIIFQTGGALTVGNDNFGFSLGNASLGLQGKTVTLSSDIINTNIGALTIIATGGPLTLNNTLTVATNGSVTFGASTALTIGTSGVINANDVTLNATTLANNGNINGTGVSATLNLDSPEALNASLTVSNTQAGSFNSFANLNMLTFGNGSINTGNLFTTTGLLKDQLTNIDITTVGTITFGSGVTELTTLAGGSLDLQSKNVVFTPTALALNTNGGDLDINLNAAITIGTTKGSFNINSTVGNLTLSALGNLTINTAVTATGTNSLLDATGAIVINGEEGPVFSNSAGTANVTVETDGTSATSAVVNTANTPIVGDHVTVERTSILASATPTYTNTQVVFLQGSATGGALNVSNLYGTPNSNAFVQSTLDQTVAAKAPTSVLFTNDSGGGGGSLELEQLSTSNGNLTVVQNNGGITVVGAGVPDVVSATNGNIVIQNANSIHSLAEITIFDGAQIIASSTKAGLGNVTIAVGAIPTPPVPGTAPISNPPTITANQGGAVYWNNTSGNAPTFVGTGNKVEALGRNVIFSAGTGSITVGSNNGGVDIHADPPADAAVNVHNSVANFATVPSVNNVVSMSAPTTSSVSSPVISIASVNSAPAISAPSLASVAATAPATSANAANSVMDSNLTTPVTFANIPASGTIALNSGNALSAAQTGVLQLNSSSVLPLVGGVSTTEAGTPVASEDSVFTGATLIAPVQDTSYKTSVGVVTVAAKSVALVLAFDGGVAVYNLHDTEYGAVQIAGKSGHKILVAPGRSALLTERHVRYFEEINPVQNAAYRHLVSKNLSDGTTLFESECSHASLISGVKPCRISFNRKIERRVTPRKTC